MYQNGDYVYFKVSNIPGTSWSLREGAFGMVVGDEDHGRIGVLVNPVHMVHVSEPIDPVCTTGVTWYFMVTDVEPFIQLSFDEVERQLAEAVKRTVQIERSLSGAIEAHAERRPSDGDQEA